MANMSIQNVTRINSNSVYNHILTFLRDAGVKSKNTKDAYEDDIRQFFMYMKNKNIEELNMDDLQFVNSDMREYRAYLYHEKKYKNTTINRKINTIISLYRALKRDGLQVDADILKLDDLPDDSNQIGILEVDEVLQMIDITPHEDMKAFLTLALHTSMRKSAMLNLYLNQIVQKYDEPDWYIITYMNKGKKEHKEIHKSVYEMLVKIASKDGKIFTTSRRTFEYRFESLCKKIGIDPKRNVSIHSLRKAGTQFAKDFHGGDIQAAQDQAAHSSISVTAKYYTKKAKNSVARILVDNVSDDVFDELTREELIQLLKSQGNGIGFKLKHEAKKIIENRKEG